MKAFLPILLLASTASAFFWTPALHGEARSNNETIRVNDPTAILKYHLAALHNVIGTRNTPLLLKMVPRGEYSKEDIDKFYEFHKGVKMDVNTANFVGDGKIQGSITFSRSRISQKGESKKISKAVATIVKDAESPTKWQLLRVEMLGGPEKRNWSIYCVIGWLACLLYD